MYRRRVVATVGVKRTIWWDGQSVTVIDQRYLPHRYVTRRWRTVDDAAEGIRVMQVRGAPLIGVAAAHGVALAMADRRPDAALDHAMDTLSATRPTAVNLRNALERIDLDVRPRPNELRAAAARVLADRLADEDAAACRAIGEIGARLIRDVADRADRPVQVLTHCNAGWLACVEWGTATAPVYTARERGFGSRVGRAKPARATRARADGLGTGAARVVRTRSSSTTPPATSWQSGQVDLVHRRRRPHRRQRRRRQQDRHVSEGLAASDSDVPFYVAAPTSTFDPRAADGRRHPHRGAGGERGHEGLRPGRQRPHHGRHRHAAGHRRAQLGFRRHAGPARVRLHHGAGTDRGRAVRHRATAVVSEPVTGAGRREVVSTRQRLSAWGLNVGTAGNVGLRVDSGLLVTPSGVPAEELRERGRRRAGRGRRAATWAVGADQRMAAARRPCWRRGPDVVGIVHTHSPEATAAACVARPRARGALRRGPHRPVDRALCAVRHLRHGGAGRSTWSPRSATA